MIARRSRRWLVAGASTTTTIASASRVALEVGKPLETQISMQPGHTPVCGLASARPACGSLGG